MYHRRRTNIGRIEASQNVSAIVKSIGRTGLVIAQDPAPRRRIGGKGTLNGANVPLDGVQSPHQLADVKITHTTENGGGNLHHRRVLIRILSKLSWVLCHHQK